MQKRGERIFFFFSFKTKVFGVNQFGNTFLRSGSGQLIIRLRGCENEREMNGLKCFHSKKQFSRKFSPFHILFHVLVEQYIKLTFYNSLVSICSNTWHKFSNTFKFYSFLSICTILESFSIQFYSVCKVSYSILILISVLLFKKYFK